MAEREQYQGQPAEGFKSLEEWGKVDAFSSEELEAWKRSPVSQLESRVIATIACLQTALEGAEADKRKQQHYIAELIDDRFQVWGRYRGLKARDRLRGEALEKLRPFAGHAKQCQTWRVNTAECSCGAWPAIKEARAAIDIKPEATREKEQDDG